MTVPSEELELAAGFEPVDRARWQDAALGVLRKSRAAGEDTPPQAVEEILATTTYDGITITPLYTAEDAPATPTGVPGSPPFVRGSQVRDLTSAGERAGGWDVRQRHDDPDPAATREAVLADLQTGATSVWLVLGGAGLPIDALPTVLDEVYLDLAPVILDAGPQTREAADALLAFAQKKVGTGLTGNLGADPLGLAARTGGTPDLSVLTDLATRIADYPGLRAGVVDATVYHGTGGSDAQELGLAIATGVAYLRALTDAGLDVESALNQLEFRFAATADQFLTIAKLRAARRLWARVAEVVGAPESGMRQHAVTSSAMMSARDPWVNMLRTTIACLAAGVGGAEAVTVAPFDAVLGLPDAFSRRIARNTQSLLLEESSLGRVLDPAGGSWYVESLTEDLARAAWTVFTEVEKAGGMGAALASGFVAETLNAVWEKRRVNIAHRRDPLTGISEFPNLTEKLPQRPEAPAPLTGGLPQVRYGQDFEALRDAADAQPERPKVFLATLGSAAGYTGRLTFTANLFQAGGLETVEAGPNLDASALATAFVNSGARVAVLCAADKVYAAEGAAAVEALSGAARIWLAGKPGMLDNVENYVFTGCDAVAVLRTTHADLGVTV